MGAQPVVKIAAQAQIEAPVSSADRVLDVERSLFDVGMSAEGKQRAGAGGAAVGGGRNRPGEVEATQKGQERDVRLKSCTRALRRITESRHWRARGIEARSVKPGIDDAQTVVLVQKG